MFPYRMLVALFVSSANAAPAAAAPAVHPPPSSLQIAGFSPGMLVALAVLLMGFGAVGYELGRRRGTG